MLIKFPAPKKSAAIFAVKMAPIIIIAKNADTILVANPIIRAEPPANSIVATTLARNPESPMLSNQPTNNL